MEHYRMISADAFGKALLAAGVIRDGERIRRLVIDVQVGQPVIIYVERFADERLLDVATSLNGIEVTTAPLEHEKR